MLLLLLYCTFSIIKIRNEAQLVSAVKSFIESSSLEGKTTPRELVRYLGNLPGSGDHSTALDVSLL